jgi:hypothetical protein
LFNLFESMKKSLALQACRGFEGLIAFFRSRNRAPRN